MGILDASSGGRRRAQLVLRQTGRSSSPRWRVTATRRRETELEQVIAGLDLARIDLLDPVADPLVSARQPGRRQRACRRLRARQARELPAARQGSLDEAVCQLADQTECRPRRDREQSRRGRGETRHDRSSHRGATPHDDRQAGANLPGATASRRALGRDEAAARDRIRATVQELWGSDELRAISLAVLDEVQRWARALQRTLAEAIPLVYRDLEERWWTVPR